MQKNKTCVQLCDPIKLSEGDVAAFVKRIDEDYNVNWMVDNLPAAATGLLEDGSVLYARGIPIGGVERDTGHYFLYNHHKLSIAVHEDPSYEGFRVVGFEVFPLSVSQSKGVHQECDEEGGMPVDAIAHMIIKGKEATPSVVFSYDVFFVPSPIQWASRWDIYLSMGGLYSDNVHWFSIINSMIISVFLTGMVAMIMVRALRADISRYNRVLTEEEKAEEREETGECLCCLPACLCVLVDCLLSLLLIEWFKLVAIRSYSSLMKPLVCVSHLHFIPLPLSICSRCAQAGSWCTATCSARPPSGPSPLPCLWAWARSCCA